MSVSSDQSLTQKPPTPFRGSLVRTVVISLLLISLLPIIIIGIITIIRTSNSLQEQTIQQLASLSESFSAQINDLAGTRTKAINEINQSEGFDQNLAVIFEGPQNEQYNVTLRNMIEYFNSYIQTPTEKIFDQIAIVDSAGTVLVASNRSLVSKNLTANNFIKSLYQSDQTVLSYGAGGLFPDQLVLITSKMYRNVAGFPAVTIIGFTTSSLPVSLLNSSQSFFEGASSYFYTTDRTLAGVDAKNGQLFAQQIETAYQTAIEYRVRSSNRGKDFQYTNNLQVPVFSYIKEISSVNASLIIEVSKESITNRIQSQLPLTIFVLLAFLVISSLIIFFGTRRMVMPMVELANNAQSFTGGDWSFRAKVDRKDEIGLLAYSFNMLVDQLTGYYRSLEEKVDERTKELRLATEIGQMIGSSTSQSELYSKASKLISDKFGYTYNAFYQIDETLGIGSLVQCTSKLGENTPEKGTSLQLSETSIIGKTTITKQTQLLESIPTDKEYSNKTLFIPSSLSAMCIPIEVDSQVVGVIDLQSDRANAFDLESSTTFSVIAGQISATLKNLRVLQSSQTDLQENVSLYRFSRQITNTNSVQEVEEKITDLFKNTNYVGALFHVVDDQIQLSILSNVQDSQKHKDFVGYTIPFITGLQHLQDEGVAVIEDFTKSTVYESLSSFYARFNCKSLGLLPVFSGEKLTYILGIGSQDNEPITLLDIQPYGGLTSIIAVTLDRLNLLAELDQRVTDLSALAAVGQVASKSVDLNELLLRFHDQIRTIMGENIGLTVAINDEEKHEVKIPYYFDYDQVNIPSYPYSNDLLSRIIAEKEPILIQDAAPIGLHIIDSQQKNISAKSVLGVPLIIGSKLLGAITLFDSENSNRFTDKDLSLIKTISPQLTAFIQNAELFNIQEQALQAYEKERFLLNSLLDNIPDQISFKDVNGNFIRVSKSTADALHAETPSQLTGKSESIFRSDIQNESTTQQDIIAINSGINDVGKIEKNIDIEGKETWLLTSRIPLINETGAVQSLLKISRDVTELISTQKIAERRADLLLTASEIARETTSGSLDISETLKRMVELVRTRFGFYHASVFLLDPIGEYAVLRESTGEAGAMLKLTGHKLAIGSPSIVGQATGKATAIVENDVTKTANYYPNPLLPKTRSELAIPLKVGSTIYGALDVQSEKVDAFTNEDINILQVMADQLTVSIQNANLFTRTQNTLERHRLIHQITTSLGQNPTIEDAIRNSVQTLSLVMPGSKVCYLLPEENGILRVRSYAGFSSSDTATLRVKPGSGIVGAVAKEQKIKHVHDAFIEPDCTPLSSDTRSILSVPVVYANVLLGVLNAENPIAGVFDENDEEVITSLANNLASILSNIRLVDQIRLQIERQQQLFEITSKIRRSVDMETIMKTSITEICNALNIRRGTIQLVSSQESFSEDLGKTPEKEH